MIKVIFSIELPFIILPISIIILLVYLLFYKIKGKQIILINKDELSISSIWFFKNTSKYPIDFIEKFELDTGNKSLENLIFFHYLDDEIHFGLDIPARPARAITKLLNEELIRLKESRTEEYLSDLIKKDL